MLRIEFFLDDLEHHYIDSHAEKPVRDAFRYLRRFLKIYPQVKPEHACRAFQMVGRIYGALGLNFKSGEKGSWPKALAARFPAGFRVA